MIDERPPRLVPTAIAAVKAAKKMPWGVKAVFIEDWILDRGPEGAWLAAPKLAVRLGMSKDNVEKHRRRLLELGFYYVVRREGARSDGWIPTLPLGCRHHGTTPEDIQNTAARIDAYLSGQVRHISGGLGGATSGARQAAIGGVPDGATSGATQYATRGVLPARRGGVRGGSLPQAVQSQTLVPPEVAARESARAPEAEEEEPREPTRAERQQMAKADEEEAEQKRREGWQKIRDALKVRDAGGRAS